MNTYYSIVSISPNPALSEKLNVGLLCVSEEQTFFHYSTVKLNLMRKLISPEAHKLAKATLDGMKETIHPKRQNTGMQLFENPINSKSISEMYLQYLNRYNNNLVQYSSPLTIDLALNESVFQQLFRKYIFPEDFVSKENVAVFEKSFGSKRKAFTTAAKTYANVNFDVTNTVISDLVVPVKVDAFGKNGAFVSGQSFDFSKNANALMSDITSYVYLSEHTKKLEKNSTCFALGDEPSKEEKQNHQFWKNVRSSNLIKLIPLDESEKIIDFMRRKGVEPVQ